MCSESIIRQQRRSPGRLLATPAKRLGRASFRVFLVLVAALALCACEKRVHPNDLPVSHWLKDEDACIRKTAESIIASGRPWPNEVWEADVNGQQYLAQFDLWIGDQLYVMPGGFGRTFLTRNGFDATHNPWKYTSVSGNLESVLDIPQQKFKVGGTLYGNVVCEWGRSPSRSIDMRRDHAPTRAGLIQLIVDKLRARPDVLKVEVIERDDIKMAEINVTTSQKTYTHAYVPRDMKQVLPDGRIAYKSIDCSQKYDPNADLTGTCGGWITLGSNNIYIHFDVYQQYLPFLPALHDHILNTFLTSRKN